MVYLCDQTNKEHFWNSIIIFLFRTVWGHENLPCGILIFFPLVSNSFKPVINLLIFLSLFRVWHTNRLQGSPFNTTNTIRFFLLQEMVKGPASMCTYNVHGMTKCTDEYKYQIFKSSLKKNVLAMFPLEHFSVYDKCYEKVITNPHLLSINSS